MFICLFIRLPEKDAVNIPGETTPIESMPADPEEAPAEAQPDLKVAAVALEDEDALEAPPIAEEEAAEPVKAKPTKASLCKLFSQMDAVEAMVLIVGTLCAMAHGVAQPLMIVIFGDLIDALGGTPEEVQRETERLSLIMCAVGGGALVAATLQGACFKIFSDSQTMKFRIMYFQDILHQDVGWFDTKEVSALSAEIQDDLSKIQDAFGDKFGNGVMALSAFLGGFVCAFGLGWLLALILSAVLPFMALGTYFVGQAVAEVQMESQGWYAKAASVVEELPTRRGGIRNGLRIGLGTGFSWFVEYSNYALAFFAGMNFAYHRELNPATGEPWRTGDIMTIFFCIFIGSFFMGQIDPSVKAMGSAQMAAYRFFKVHDNKPAIQRRDADERKEVSSIETFAFEQVHFSYPARPSVTVLGGVTLTINRGQKVAFVGESGSGKSTIMALLERFYDPSSGVVYVNGWDMRTFKILDGGICVVFLIGALRKCIGYVGQEPVLFSQSIRANIMQGNPEATKEQFQQACADAQLTFVDTLPEKYNTIDNISSTTRSLGIVSIAHRLSTIRNSDLIYVLSRGQVVEQGNHQSLIEKKGVYYALVAAQESSQKAEEAEELELPNQPTVAVLRQNTGQSDESEMARKESSSGFIDWPGLGG
eukprot:s1995_g2.t1